MLRIYYILVLNDPNTTIFFAIQFAFLYDGYKNESQFDAKATVGFLFIGGLILLLGAGSLGEAGLLLGPLVEGLFGAEGLIFSSEGLLGSEGLQGIFDSLSGLF